MARRLGKKIDFVQWDAIPSFRQSSSSETTFVIAGLTFLAPATILRSRCDVLFQFDATVQVDDRLTLGVGLGLVSTDAFTFGATAMPDPLGEPEYPWLYWREINIEQLAVTPDFAGIGFGERFEVDTKAMRKVKPGQTLTWVFQYANGAGSPSATTTFGQTRVLIGT